MVYHSERWCQRRPDARQSEYFCFSITCLLSIRVLMYGIIVQAERHSSLIAHSAIRPCYRDLSDVQHITRAAPSKTHLRLIQIVPSVRGVSDHNPVREEFVQRQQQQQQHRHPHLLFMYNLNDLLIHPELNIYLFYLFPLFMSHTSDSSVSVLFIHAVQFIRSWV